MRDHVLHLPFVLAVILPPLGARSALRTQRNKLHKILLDQIRTNPICRRFMTAPGARPVVALTYCTCVNNPAWFGRTQCVGAYYGPAPRLYQSGETMRVGRVSKCGDTVICAAPYEGGVRVADEPARPVVLAEGLGAGCGQALGSKPNQGIARAMVL